MIVDPRNTYPEASGSQQHPQVLLMSIERGWHVVSSQRCYCLRRRHNAGGDIRSSAVVLAIALPFSPRGTRNGLSIHTDDEREDTRPLCPHPAPIYPTG